MSPHEARAMLADGRATLVAGDPIVDTRDPVLVSSQMADPVPVFAAHGVPRRRRR
jgi:hypothetical protein